MERVKLNIENLSVQYGKSVAVEKLDCSISNETVVFFGASGCGKTSILKAILGVHDPGMKINGSITLNGQPIIRGNGDVGMTIQGPVIPEWITVYDLCSMGSKIRKKNPLERKKRIFNMLRLFNIEHLAYKYPKNLSGGEKQRAALAITLLNEPKVLLLDEPTTFIDGTNRSAIWKYIEEKIYPLRIPIIVVSHDPLEALILGDRVIFLSRPAKVNKEIKIQFPHPRNEELYRHEKFWELKKEFLMNNVF